MSRSPLSNRVSLLQRNSHRIRNICVMAHVDHGKTTISDSLIASNGIITQRMAGKLRYMDSRKDEQERGITMKSSAISLSYMKEEEDYLINLIDSPGHVDFTGEVSSAIQLCDGALILIDVVEGVCAQTKVSIRQAWSNDIKMVLILNKMDRLIIDMKLTPLDAYYHLQQILEQVNAVVGELFTSDVLGRSGTTTTDNFVNTDSNSADDQVYDWSSGLEETDDSNLYFSPDQGNVVFASGIDCWGFRIHHFAKMYAQKLDIREDVLLKTLWGDFYLNSKVKRIMKGAQTKAKRPLFVQFILENIWAVYTSVLEKRDKEMTEKIIKSLNIKLSARDSKAGDPRAQLQAICTQWLPLAQSVLEMVCEKLPSPASISEERAEKLMCTKGLKFESLPAETQKLKHAFCKCSSALDAPTIVFVSKMFPIEKSSLPRPKQRLFTMEEMALRREIARQRHLERIAKGEFQSNSDSSDGSTPLEMSVNSETKLEKNVPEDEHVFIAFARIFSGTIRKGQQLYVLGPKHVPELALKKDISVDPILKLDDLKADEHITLATIEDLYILMGRELEELDEVPAGCIFGIGHLEEHLIKTATLSSTVACPSFTDLTIHSIPIMRVAIEPVHPGDMPQLVSGLKLLNQADPSVRVLIQETGEHVIITAGEVHLERCLDDLRQRFAKIEINSSTPIVPFRETVVERPKVDMVNEVIEDTHSQTQSKDSNSVINHLGLVEVKTLNKLSTIKMRSVPLPDKVITLLDEHSELIKSFDKFTNFIRKSSGGHEKSIIDGVLTDTLFKSLETLKEKLNEAFEASGNDWAGAVNQVWSFGPRRCGPNVLLLRAPQCNQPSYWSASSVTVSRSSDFDGSFLTGFQLATNSGPLCEEPMRGVCFVVESWTIDELRGNNETDTSVRDVDSERHNYGPFSGQLISAVREACRKAFQAQPQRLMAAMYSCNILVTADVLGKMYAVLNKRHGQVLHGDMQEGSTMFYVTAVLPVIESFDFASEIRRQTSGQAMPQLTFSHWEVIETDPFWVPTTAEEYLLYGEKADSENRARKYVNLVRKRKGLAVDEKIVEHAEKQRTLAKKK